MGSLKQATLQHVQAPRFRRSPRRCDRRQPPSLRSSSSLPRCSSLQGGEAPPPSLSPTSTEWLITTARPTSRRQSHKMAMESSLSFVIALPDGRIQTTTYTADHHNGFVADVTYEGTPVYPPEPKEGYGHA